MTAPARPGLLEVISAFFAAEREAVPGQLWLGPCDRAEPDLGHDYDGPELHPGTPEYEAGYREYQAAEAEPRTYITEIWSPARDDGIQRLHSPMREPEPEPEAEI
jgi:hypothetical protein